ncbi:Levansucrase [Trichinella pseudospiralis]
MGMPVEESRHEECRAETSKAIATITDRRVALKTTGKEEERTQATGRAHGDGRSSCHRTSNGPSPKTTPTTPSTPTSPRTPPVSKRGARTKLPSTPEEVTPSTSSGDSDFALCVNLHPDVN